MGMEGAVLQPAVPAQRAHGIDAREFTASISLGKKGKNKKTRNLYLCTEKFHLNRPFFLHL